VAVVLPQEQSAILLPSYRRQLDTNCKDGVSFSSSAQSKCNRRS